MSALRLLELQKEFSEFESLGSIARSHGLEPERTRQDIAEEYGNVLREFLKS